MEGWWLWADIESIRIRVRAEGSRGLVGVGSHYVRRGLGVSMRA